VVIARGEVWWADLDEPVGSAPGYRRPVLVVQEDGFNRSRISTIIVVVLTSNMQRLDAPGNVLVPAAVSGLPRDSVANVSHLMTVDRGCLAKKSGRLPARMLAQVNDGLRLILNLTT
jgi:mRNA interferase MazF